MPAPIHVSGTSANSRATKPAAGRKTRIIRRRGRAVNQIGSDEEIEREVATDSDSPSEDSSVDSDSESVSEPTSEQHAHTTNNIKPAKVDATPFLSTPWAEMVSDENANGEPADLPVIDFADFDSHEAITIIPKVTSKPKPAAPTPAVAKVARETETPRAEETTKVERGAEPNFRQQPGGPSARQAYQSRLQTDPSFVPQIGEFWGHDDRLLGKDLRSMSGWWRGRWQGATRGRGSFDRGFSGRGRGRGGFTGTRNNVHANVEQQPEPVAPVDRAWTHDGFHDMKKREESRREAEKFLRAQAQRDERVSARGGRNSNRGRGAAPNAHAGRPWFAMKPEPVWTKQHDKYLHEDTAGKLRPGQAPTIRIKLATDRVQVIRASSSSKKPASVQPKSVPAEDEDSAALVVRLPKRAGKQKAVDNGLPTPPAEPSSAIEESVEDVFKVRPRLVNQAPNPLPEPASSVSISAKKQQEETKAAEIGAARTLKTEEAILRRPSVDESAAVPSANVDFRPVFSPPIPQTSPVYGSPYGFAPVPLPMGVGMNQQGMPYELATGRPVYLQNPPMFNPSPMHMGPPGIPFAPSHLRHPSSTASPDFLQSHTPPMNGFFDPATGAPIFAPPRQSSRIEIRSPPADSSEHSSSKPSSTHSRHLSSLRTTATSFEPSRSTDATQEGIFPSISTPDNSSSYATLDNGRDEQQSGLMYAPYQQPQYYYPEAYPQSYNYPPHYADLSHQYESYPPPDPQSTRQGTVYYQ